MLLKGNARDWQTRLRLWAAVIMLTYVVSHTINFGLGIFSLKEMNLYQSYVLRFWRSDPLYWLVCAAIPLHMSLGLWKLFKRNTLKMPPWEVAQITMGLCIPFFLLAHILYTRGMHLLYGLNDTYAYELLRTYPGGAWQYVCMILIVWGHAQIGIHFVLRSRTRYPRLRPLVIALFLFMPLWGIAGYIVSGEEVMKLSRNPDWLREERSKIPWPEDEQLATVRNASLASYAAFPLLFAVVLGARGIRLYTHRGSRVVEVKYTSGMKVMVTRTTTILEASRIGGIPHASICGGRGRCSTCRVRIVDGLQALKPPGEREQRVLDTINAGDDVRLACQTECNANITVALLLPPDITAAIARKAGTAAAGRETTLVVMFADLRGFTKLSEGRLPYDIVFLLNRYFNSMGEAIEENGGFIDKFLGDGIMALFGLKTDIASACRQSLTASKAMARRLDEINEQLAHDLKEPLQLGIGLHLGDVILGEMGYRNATKLTAIGDTVNTASRLEVLNKKAGSQLIFSKEIAERGGIDTAPLTSRTILIRGKEKPLDVYIVTDIASLPG